MGAIALHLLGQLNSRMPDASSSKSALPQALALVLAAGQGTRMKSDLPKVLVPVCGRPMIRFVIDALRAAGIPRTVVVVGYRAELIEQELTAEPGIEFAQQPKQLGTGHAVMMCRKQLATHRGPVLIVTGDSPMLRPNSIRKLLELFQQEQSACVIGTVKRDDPTGYGRVIRSEDGEFLGVVEEKDATDEQRAIREVNVSTYLFDAAELLFALEQLTDQNAQSEYYITDCPAVLLAAGKRVSAHMVLEPCESLGINSMDELRAVEAAMQRLESAPAGGDG